MTDSVAMTTGEEVSTKLERSPEEAAYRVLMHQAKVIAESGLFGIKTPQQALALMLISQAEGRHPALAARDYDIIQGRPAKKAEAMLRDFLGAGGKVEWHELSDTKADATFSHVQGGSVRIVWDLERVKKAQISNEQMYRKYPRQMLRSRTVSEGVRTIWPAATSGMYEPDEVRGFVEERNEKAGSPEERLGTDSSLTRAVARTGEGQSERHAQESGNRLSSRPSGDDHATSPLVTPLKDADLTALGKLPAALTTTDADELALDARMEKAEKRQTAKAGKP